MGVTEFLVLLSMALGVMCLESSNRCSMPTDIILLLDGSGSVEDDEWINEISFAERFIETLDIRPDGIRVGVVTYGKIIGDVIDLEPFIAKSELKTRLRGLKQPMFNTNTALGIEQVRVMFRSQGRPDVNYKAVVLTDGNSNNQTDTIKQAQSAKSDGIVMTAVGIGENINMTELKAIASSEKHLLNVSDFESLPRLLEDLTKGICRVEVDLTCKPILHFANGNADRQHEKGTEIAVTNLNLNKERRLVFTGQSSLEIQSLSGFELGDQLFLKIHFKMSPLPPRRNPLFGQQQRPLQPLVANCEPWWNGKKPSIWIFVGPSTVELAIKTEKEDNPATFNMPLKSGFNTVTLTYDGSHVVARVNGGEETRPLTGKIERRQTGISLGKCTGFPSFVGEVDEFEISRCVSSSRYARA